MHVAVAVGTSGTGSTSSGHNVVAEVVQIEIVLEQDLVLVLAGAHVDAQLDRIDRGDVVVRGRSCVRSVTCSRSKAALLNDLLLGNRVQVVRQVVI